jgi:hypothetical protein
MGNSRLIEEVAAYMASPLARLRRVDEIGPGDMRAGTWVMCSGLNGKAIHDAVGVVQFDSHLLPAYLTQIRGWRWLGDEQGKQGRWLCKSCARQYAYIMRVRTRRR